MKYHKRYFPYEDRFLLFSAFFEKIIKKTLILLIAILLLIQTFLSFDSVRKIIVPVELLERSLFSK